MKNLFVALLLIIFISLSCSKDDFDIDKFPQKWVLVKTTGQMVNFEAVGNDMPWQEYYLFNSDGNFKKHREWGGVSYDAYGHFTPTDITEGKLLELTYNSDYEIIGSCYGNQTEGLWMESNKKLVGTWMACDGPGLEYKRVE